MRDRDFLIWLHERLELVHKEKPTLDYMHKLRAIILATNGAQETPNTCTDSMAKLQALQLPTYCYTDQRCAHANHEGKTTLFFQHPFNVDVAAEKLFIRNLPLETMVEYIQIENCRVIFGPVEFLELPKPIIVRYTLKPASRIEVSLSGLKAGTRLYASITVIGNHVECPTI